MRCLRLLEWDKRWKTSGINKSRRERKENSLWSSEFIDLPSKLKEVEALKLDSALSKSARLSMKRNNKLPPFQPPLKETKLSLKNFKDLLTSSPKSLIGITINVTKSLKTMTSSGTKDLLLLSTVRLSLGILKKPLDIRSNLELSEPGSQGRSKSEDTIFSVLIGFKFMDFLTVPAMETTSILLRMNSVVQWLKI